MLTSHFDPHALKNRVRRENYGFLTESDVKLLAECGESRLWLLLVRCGMGRAMVAAQDVAWLIRSVEAAGDYVRDVSFPAER